MSIHQDSSLIIDNRVSGDLNANNGKRWRAVTDTLMGGISKADLCTTIVLGKPCLRLSGEVCLENNGGFVQASLDLGEEELLDASAFRGVSIEVLGNNESYNVHLRTGDTQVVWQSYRHSFTADANWKVLHIPFADFIRHRTLIRLDTRQLRRIGIVAIGRKMEADICFSRIALYR